MTADRSYNPAMLELPAWIWPRFERRENTLRIRVGRHIHYTGIALGIALGCGAVAHPSGSADAGDFVVMGTVFALLGRGMRYLLARE